MSEAMWYFEDFETGRTIEVGTRSITEEEIIAFATQFDPQPFHVDKEAAVQIDLWRHHCQWMAYLQHHDAHDGGWHTAQCGQSRLTRSG